MTRILGIVLSWSALAVSIGLVGILGYWYWLDYPLRDHPLTVHLADPYTSDLNGEPKAVFRPGERVFVNWTIDVSRGADCETTIERTLHNGISRRIGFEGSGLVPEAERRSKKGTALRTFFTLDELIPGGVYRYEVAVIWRCNPIREFVEPMPYLEFEVEGSDYQFEQRQPLRDRGSDYAPNQIQEVLQVG
jgi:hypothetical protein